MGQGQRHGRAQPWTHPAGNSGRLGSRALTDCLASQELTWMSMIPGAKGPHPLLDFPVLTGAAQTFTACRSTAL